MQKIFNRKLLELHKNRAAQTISESEFFQESAIDIMQRLELLDKDFTNILDLGSRTGHLLKLLQGRYREANIMATEASRELQAIAGHKNQILIDEEDLSSLSSTSFDLITFSLGLHLINDVQKFLTQVCRLLKNDGIFITNFIGGGSLKNLRTEFIEAEVKSGSKHFAHIPPFIQFDQVPALFQQALFKSVIVDFEDIELAYTTPVTLMRDIKRQGESNILSERSNYAISRALYQVLNSPRDQPFLDKIRIINVIASKEKESIKPHA